MNWLGLIATIPSSHSEEQRFWVIVLFGRLNDYVPVLVILEAACVKKLIFPILLASLCVFVSKVIVGELGLGVLVEKLHIGVLKSCKL